MERALVGQELVAGLRASRGSATEAAVTWIFLVLPLLLLLVLFASSTDTKPRGSNLGPRWLAQKQREARARRVKQRAPQTGGLR